MKKLIITFTVIVVSTCSLYSQNRTINGRVISNQFDVLIGVSIMINDSVKVGRTDLKGFFQIEIPDSVKKILFRDVGLDPTAVVLADSCKQTEVIMMLSGTDDFITLKKADRLRMKRFKKLPEFHREAFAKGIFKTEKACYTPVFIPHYKKKEK